MILNWVLAQLLRLANPRRLLGRPLADAIMRLWVTPAFEAVCLRTRGGRIEVFLTQRPKDQAHGGQWHCPGTLWRPGESTETTAARLADKEFTVPFRSHQFAGFVCNPDERGFVISLLFLVELEGESEGGLWFDVERLPEPICPAHRDAVIPEAVARWRRREPMEALLADPDVAACARVADLRAKGIQAVPILRERRIGDRHAGYFVEVRTPAAGHIKEVP